MSHGKVTEILHYDHLQGAEYGSSHKATFTGVAFGYQKAQDLAAVFQGAKTGFAYSRQNSPTVGNLEGKITALEGGVASLCFATGMAAIGSMIFALLKRGDHLISSRFLFGNTVSLLKTFENFGLEVTLVDATDLAACEQALKPETKMVLLETIGNPVTQIADLEGIGQFCKKNNLIYVVDNTMTSSASFLPKTVGASFSMQSLTKYLSGHGDSLGGVLTDLGTYDWTSFDGINPAYRTAPPASQALLQIRRKGLRDFGATLSPENAHRISVGMETLFLRYERSCHNAMALATFLAGQASIKKVYYPGLSDHPQHQRSARLFCHHGALLSFELADQDSAMELLNRLKLVIISTNLGDTRTLALTVANTIFYESGAELRKEMGIADGLIRVSVGIEDVKDVIEDFSQALSLSL